MIRAAWQHVRHRTAIELSFGDPAEELRTVDDEHMLDQARVVRQVAAL